MNRRRPHTRRQAMTSRKRWSTNRRDEQANKITDGLFSDRNLAAQDPWHSLCHHLADGFLYDLCGTPCQRVHSRSGGAESRWTGRFVSTGRGYCQVAVQGRFQSAKREHFLLLAGALPGADPPDRPLDRKSVGEGKRV